MYNNNIFCYLLESLKSPQDHEKNSPSMLEISIDEPFTLSTPDFYSLPSYQASYRTRQYIFFCSILSMRNCSGFHG